MRAASEPVIDSGAKVESINYTLSSEGGSTNAPAFDLTGIIYLVFVFCLIALALTWLFPVAVDGAAAMVRQRTVAHLVTGLVGMVAALPVTLVLLLVAPLAGALVGVVLAIFLVAAPFAGASLVRLAFPGWNRFGAAALGGAIAGVLGSIPYVRAIFIAAAFVYLLGYVLQSIYLGMHAPTARQLEDATGDAPVPPSTVHNE